jgi:hypothetical protein
VREPPFHRAPVGIERGRGSHPGVELRQPALGCSTHSLEIDETWHSILQQQSRSTWFGPGRCHRRDLLDHVNAVNERHGMRLLSECVRYYHENRTLLALVKGTPRCRTRSVASGRILSHERIGGMHHRYDRAAFPKRSARKPQRSKSILNVYVYVLDQFKGCWQ